MKRIVSLLTIFIILFSNIASFADEPIIVDYIDYLNEFREKYQEEHKKTFNTPTSIFKATIDGEEYIVEPFMYPYKEGEEQIDDDTLYEDDFKSVPVHITVPVGTKIDFECISEVGDGNNYIKLRDWQVYKLDENHKQYEMFKSKDNPKEINVAIDKEGYVLVFLTVADDFQYGKLVKNWSEKGNWRTTYIYPELRGNDIQVEGWYFTVMKIGVEDGPDFSIEPINSFIEKELDDVSSESIGFKINLAGTDESIDTIVDFYQDKTLIDSKHITVKESEEVYFNVDAARLKEGENNFYAVVNSNFDLTKAHPYGEENI